MNQTDINDQVVGYVLTLLSQFDTAPTDDVVKKLIPNSITMAQALYPDGKTTSNFDTIYRRINGQIAIVTADSVGLANDADHQVWLPQRRSQIDWNFWNRYEQLLSRDLPGQVVKNLGSVTDDVLARIEDPTRPGEWDRRGLVVGQVQSGKTANYIGLINKAIDAGYKFVIVLAGLHDSLRSQTQYRVDEGVIGKDSSIKSGLPNQFGVGNFPARLNVMSLTDSTDKGDFSINGAQQVTFSLGSDPVVLVVKKNSYILRNLMQWIASNNTGRFASGRPIIADVPMLLLDDEADSASINTADEEDPSTINRLVREILHSFTQSAYVGYTATPFANIFTDDQATTEEQGPSLFPASFIVHLRPPSNYIGADKVFGLNGQVESNPLPITRHVDDYQLWIPDKHKKDVVPGPIPDSFKLAFDSFVLTCAARRARGQTDRPNSMLVHVTRFVDVQTKVTFQIKDELLEPMRDELRQGGPTSESRLRLRQLWETDYQPSTEAVLSRNDGLLHADDVELNWEAVDGYLAEAIELIEVRAINGTSKEGLADTQRGGGLSVIAVGGDKLSRGLTLADLSVSYYLRASKMYDTLMQMGRWFGYRPRYIDLCRLFTTRELQSWYRYIATSSNELVGEFERMAAQDLDPTTYGLRVRSHPDGLLVTARNKMKNGESVFFSYADSIPEAKSYDLDRKVREHQERELQRLIEQLRERAEPETELKGNLVWRGASHEPIVSFFESIYEPPNARKTRPKLMAQYIRNSVQRGKLTDWTVVVVSNSQDKVGYSLADQPIGRTNRSSYDDVPDPHFLAFNRLVSPPDEMIDLSSEERQVALESTWEAAGDRTRKVPGPLQIRRARPPERGLLLLYILNAPEHLAEPANSTPLVGYAASFPAPVPPDPGEQIEYKVNQVYASFLGDD